MSKKIRNNIFLVGSILLNALIIIEASLTPELSSAQSDWLGNIFIHEINEHTSVPQDIVELESIKVENANPDSDGSIIRGTTQRLNVTLTPSNASDKVITYTCDNPTNFNLIPNGSVCYVEALGNLDETTTITASCSDFNATIDFKIIDRVAPTFYSATLKNSTIKLNTSEKINVTLLDDPSDTSIKEENRNDQYRLVRYYDKDKLDYQIANPSIARIENGYIKALNVGSTSLIINKDKENETIIPINIENNPEPNIIPTDFDITLSSMPHVYDLDYAKDHLEEVATNLDVSFKGATPTDTNVYFDIEDNLTSILLDDKLFGYKKMGVATLKATSIANPSLTKEIEIKVEEVKAENFTISYSTKDVLRVGNDLQINASFEPFNTTNLNLLATSSNPSVAKVTSKGRVINVTCLEMGEVSITLKSESNPSIENKVIELKVDKKVEIEEEDEDAFKHTMRKYLGHFLLFLVDGLILGLTFVFYLKDKSFKGYALNTSMSLLTGLFIAAFSEFVQCFNGRGASIKDVGIDFFGYFFGVSIIILVLLILFAFKKYQAKKALKEPQNKKSNKD